MLEGKELEGKIGEVGGYYLDINENFEVELGVSAKVDVIAEIEKIAAKTETKIDDHVASFLKTIRDKYKELKKPKA